MSQQPVAPDIIEWMYDTKDVLSLMDIEVRRDVGLALYFAQNSEKHPSAKPLKGFGGAAVLEIVSRHDGDTYRCVYTVRFAGAIYVLHVFQKKSKHGIATPQSDLELIRKRLKEAEGHYQRNYGSMGS